MAVAHRDRAEPDSIRINVDHHGVAILAGVPVGTTVRYRALSPRCREDVLTHWGPRGRERLVRPMVLAGATR